MKIIRDQPNYVVIEDNQYTFFLVPIFVGLFCYLLYTQNQIVIAIILGIIGLASFLLPFKTKISAIPTNLEIVRKSLFRETKQNIKPENIKGFYITRETHSSGKSGMGSSSLHLTVQTLDEKTGFVLPYRLVRVSNTTGFLNIGFFSIKTPDQIKHYSTLNNMAQMYGKTIELATLGGVTSMFQNAIQSTPKQR